MQQQGRHHPKSMMGDPGLLQDLPDITALLSEGGRDCQQVAAADRTLAGLDAMAVARQIPDLALNNRLSQGSYSCGEDCLYRGSPCMALSSTILWPTWNSFAYLSLTAEALMVKIVPPDSKWMMKIRPTAYRVARGSTISP